MFNRAELVHTPMGVTAYTPDRDTTLQAVSTITTGAVVYVSRDPAVTDPKSYLCIAVPGDYSSIPFNFELRKNYPIYLSADRDSYCRLLFLDPAEILAGKP